MKKYIKLDLTEIRYFEDDVDVGSWVDLLEYRPMTGDEVLRHETPKPSNHHTEWDGKSWVDVHCRIGSLEIHAQSEAER